MAKWFSHELDYLKKHYYHGNGKNIALVLNKSIKSVQQKAYKMGLSGKQPAINIGIKFSKLVIMADLNQSDNLQRRLVLCVCDCGTSCIKPYCNLLNKTDKCCGCSLISSLKRQSGTVAWNKLYKSYRDGAARRNLEFQLTYQEFKDICQQNCYYCNALPRKYNPYINTKTNEIRIKTVKPEHIHLSEIFSNGIDRKNNVGYIRENCIPCCKKCNFAKGSLTFEEFIQLIKNIANNLQIGYNHDN